MYNHEEPTTTKWGWSIQDQYCMHRCTYCHCTCCTAVSYTEGQSLYMLHCCIIQRDSHCTCCTAVLYRGTVTVLLLCAHSITPDGIKPHRETLDILAGDIAVSTWLCCDLVGIDHLSDTVLSVITAPANWPQDAPTQPLPSLTYTQHLLCQGILLSLTGLTHFLLYFIATFPINAIHQTVMCWTPIYMHTQCSLEVTVREDNICTYPT